jgi:uncharacterized alpha-E superfamily protein
MRSMLSRTAHSLYWIGRYMERAEFTTRLVEATIRLASLSRDAQSDKSAWRSALAVVGASEPFEGDGEKFTAFNVTRYLTLAEENANSVRSCLFMARDNARAARNAMTRECWEAINRAWLDIRDRTSPGGTQATLNLVETLKADTRGFEGALSRMLLREAYWFMRLGSVIERGDNTARLLDVKYYVLLPTTDMVGGSIDTYQWTTLLRALSAYRAFHWTYGGEYSPRKIAHFLILNRSCPRSLLHCQAKAEEHLGWLARAYGARTPAHERMHVMLGELAEARVEDVIEEGLHAFLSRFIYQNAALGQDVADSYLFGVQ